MAWVAPVISGIASLAGGAMSNSGAGAANRANQRSQDIAWDRELYASNTAYQRAVADMKAAGLNPMLAYQQGGASAPSTTGVRNENTQAGTAQAMAQIAQTVANSALMSQQKDLLKAQAEANLASAQSQRLNAESVEQQIRLFKDTYHNKLSTSDIELEVARNARDISNMDWSNRYYFMEQARRAIQQDFDLKDMDVKQQQNITAMTGIERELAELGMAKARNLNSVEEGKLGAALKYISAIRESIFGGSSPVKSFELQRKR